MDSNQSTANTADVNHLFGIKRPFNAPLYLSYPLTGPRRLSPDEAAQICARDSAIKPTTRDGWELTAITIAGAPHVALSKMTSRRGQRRIDATRYLSIGGEGVLRLSSPSDTVRRLSEDECRQLHSFGGLFAKATTTWALMPIQGNPNQVSIYRYKDVNRLHVGSLPTVAFFHSPPQIKQIVARPDLSAQSLAILCNLF